MCQGQYYLFAYLLQEKNCHLSSPCTSALCSSLSSVENLKKWQQQANSTWKHLTFPDSTVQDNYFPACTVQYAQPLAVMQVSFTQV